MRHPTHCSADNVYYNTEVRLEDHAYNDIHNMLSSFLFFTPSHAIDDGHA